MVFWCYCTKNKMTVIWEYSVSYMKIYSKYSFEVHQSKQRINFNSVCFFTLVFLLDSLKLSLRGKRAIVLFILVFVHSTTLSMISLSKYKWKVSLIFFNIVCSRVWGKTTYSTWNGIVFSLFTSGYWML